MMTFAQTNCYVEREVDDVLVRGGNVLNMN